ncbi:hypothetical protein [Cellulomonas edaphi]|uniref:Uncharacterized protein n=1 Tax=Cellulomonas edaphi TaxID=3053468 RepID=A0ABT7S5G6_9CELL|nr:hypothetical protein [Cellulomons edaphi]MDM7830224.1 hypothetical protein [Cellulomons edaphi]
MTLLLPASWWLVDPTSDRARERSIAALVEQRLGGDHRAALRAEARAALGQQARTAARAGAFLLALSVMQWRDVPLPAALAGYRVPRAGGDELSALADELARGPNTAVLVTAERGALLRRTSVGAPPGSPVPGAPVFRADYWLDLPGAADIVLLTFGTPMVDAAAGFLDLFDAIVDTVETVDTVDPVKAPSPTPAPPHEKVPRT